MRSEIWIAALLLLGCGNYSTEDVRFLAAVPTSEMLRLSVPAPVAPQPPSTCTIAEAWIKAKTAGDNLNANVGAVFQLVERLRELEPSHRAPGTRIWGPFDAPNHPDREAQIVLRRSDTCAPGSSVCYLLTLQARVKGQVDFMTLLDATLQGGSAENGSGSLLLHFDTLQALGMSDSTSASGTLSVEYARTANQRSIDLTIQRPSAILPQFDYKWRGSADGSGSFTYAFTNAQGNTLTAVSHFNSAGEGGGNVVATVNGFDLGFQECWDGSACLSWLNDPHNLTKLCLDKPCELGSQTACRVPPP